MPVRPDGPPADSAQWWGREMFLSVDVPDGKCPPIIDATGRARVLMYGPYAMLAPGAWRAVAHLELCPDAAQRRLAIQFGVGQAYTTVDVPGGPLGLRKIQIDHVCREPGHAELRLVLKRAAFHGRVRFLGASIERVAVALTSQG